MRPVGRVAELESLGPTKTTNTMKLKPIIHWFLILACASCTFAADNTARQKDEDDIQEAVLRELFDRNPSTLQKRATAYYLAIGEKKGADPTEEFLKRFAGHKPPVLKRSAAALSPDQGVVTDKQTGGRGLIFRLYGVKWLSESEAELRGGCAESAADSLVNTYTVKKDNGKWKVTKSAGFRKA